MPSSRIIASFALALLIAAPLSAQDQAPGWEPLGPLPVDQAGAGRRGYGLSDDSADVTEAGASRVALHMVAANDFYREQTADFLISRRAETHTMALEYRRGFDVGNFPRLEIGGQVQFNESDAGMLNGFIRGFENAWVSMTGMQSARDPLRANAAVMPPLGTIISKSGRPVYVAPGIASGIGDVYLFAKAALLDPALGARTPRVAARIALNVAGSSVFSDGNFAAVGLGAEQKVNERLALHADVRATLILDRVSVWNLPLQRGSFGFSAGPELKIARGTSASLQIDGSTTPYLPTGTSAFDANYGAIVFGVSHRFAARGRRHVLAQIYGRENMNLPFQVRWNMDPDFAIGLKTTIY